MLMVKGDTTDPAGQIGKKGDEKGELSCQKGE